MSDTGSDFVNKLLNAREPKPVWLNPQAHAAIFTAATIKANEVMRDADILSREERMQASAIINEYLSSKISHVAERVDLPLNAVIPQGNKAGFKAWHNEEILSTMVNQLEQTEPTDDQLKLMRKACGAADMLACQMLAASRTAYEKEMVKSSSYRGPAPMKPPKER